MAWLALVALEADAMGLAMARNVTLLLVDGDGEVQGALPPFSVSTPWWQVVDDVVNEVYELHGLELSVLRLLSTDRPRASGGETCYSAQLDLQSSARVEGEGGLRALVNAHGRRVPLHAPPPEAVLELARAPHPLRAAWARPGGPSRSIGWARDVLRGAGRGAYAARQHRTWNLSAIWRLDPMGARDAAGPVWLKQVPAFFAHEGAVLEWLRNIAPRSVAALIAQGPEGRVLLEHAPGHDRHDAPAVERDAFARIAHGIQCAARGASTELIERGVPDRRGHALAVYIQNALASVAEHVSLDQSVVTELLDRIDPIIDALEECGFPDTLVHGDLHPGNVRGEGEEAVIIDWGDAFVGHPGFDILRMAEGLAPDVAAHLLASWSMRWRRERPRCEPERAIALLRPLAALHGAAVYSMFVASIEPSERVYHMGDIRSCLDKARSLARDEAPSAQS